MSSAATAPAKTEVPSKTPVARDLVSAGSTWSAVQWNSQNTIASLEEIRKLVEDETEKAITWYYQRKRNKVLWSQWLRMLAVLLGSIGAGIPFIAATGFARDAAGAVTELSVLRLNQWGYVFILGAGACVAVDKLFGFSTNWIRFVDAATKLQTVLGTFRLQWYKEMALADMGGRSAETVTKLFDTLADFATRSREVIEKETGDWIAEFRSNLTKLADDTKAAQEAREKQILGQVDQIRQIAREREQKSGAVAVTISNFAALGAGFTWSLEIDNEPRKGSIDRPIFIVKGLDPGVYLVSVFGTSKGVVVHAAQTVVVETGKSAAASFNLQ